MKKLLALVAILGMTAALSACHSGSADYSNVNEPEYAYGQSTDTTSGKVEEHFNKSQNK